MNETTRKKLTVERIVEILGRNDFYEKGASIQENVCEMFLKCCVCWGC